MKEFFGARVDENGNPVWCEQCGEDHACVFLKYANLCDSCFEEEISEDVLFDFFPYKICGTIIWQENGFPALCLSKWGEEHSHS